MKAASPRHRPAANGRVCDGRSSRRTDANNDGDQCRLRGPPLPISEADLGLPWNWRIGPAARAVSDASDTALAFTPAGRSLVPFAPVHVAQPWQTAPSPGAPTLTDMGASFAIATGGVLTLFIAAPPNGSSVCVKVVGGVSGAVFEQEITTDLLANCHIP